MSRCAVCVHVRRSEIEQVAAAGIEKFGDLARRFGVHRDALMRHRQRHLPEHLKPAAKREAAILREVREEALEILQENLRSARRESKVREMNEIIDRIIRLSPPAANRGEAPPPPGAAMFDSEAALRMVIADLERRGYRVVPPDELAKEEKPS